MRPDQLLQHDPEQLGWLIVSRASRALQVTEHEILQRIKSGGIRGAIKIGPSWLIPVSEIKRLRKSQEIL
jgi:hypothetical protein